MNIKHILMPFVGLLLVAVGSLIGYRLLVSPAMFEQPRVAVMQAPILEEWANPRDLMLRGCASLNDYWILLTGSDALINNSSSGMWRATEDLRRTREATMKADSQLFYLRGDLEGCESMSIRLQVLNGQPWSGTLNELRNEFTRVGISEHLRATMPDAFATVPPDTKRQREHWKLVCRADLALEDIRRIRQGQFAPKSELDAKRAACG